MSNEEELDAIEPDDVEAHGLKEIAIGIAAVGAIAGGAAAAASPSTTAAMPTPDDLGQVVMQIGHTTHAVSASAENTVHHDLSHHKKPGPDSKP